MTHQLERCRVQVTGNVQGVGFRPFVWKRANDLGLVGWVLNDSSGVICEIQGSQSQLDEFLRGFAESAPELARIDAIRTTPVTTLDDATFEILTSAAVPDASTLISADVSICGDCLAELRDPSNHRYRYAFINCTNCGPRFTIVEDIPYDRRLTTMKSFVMCGTCRREYDAPSNRRFHAQPNACPDCGPSVWFVDQPGFEMNESADDRIGDQQQAIEAFKRAIRLGKIVAVKGVGGFHLVCDATQSGAVHRLRERKGRPDRPLALMVAGTIEARSLAVVDSDEQRHLESKPRPIVLLKKRRDVASLEFLKDVAPGNDSVGIMLPYSPLHYLLVESLPPLVMTSGNLSDEPIAHRNDEARKRLGGLADGFLFHDREIHIACDDSVVRCVDGQLLPIRRSRGYAPMPVRLPGSGPSVLAMGGEIKSTFCVTKENDAFMSQHLGDIGNVETVDAMRRSVEHFLRLFRVDVEAVAADLHPGYLSGQWATEFANSLGVPLLRVQHHCAHVAALIAEHDVGADRRIIGCCFDGTGFGTDEAIWGGEFLIGDGMTFDRCARLGYVRLPGGDACIRRPYRSALAQLWSKGMDWSPNLPCVAACPAAERKLLRQQLDKNVNCVPTSSMGRLFDAAASLIGVRHEVSYEAQAAMEMEALAADAIDRVDPHAYSFRTKRTSLLEIDNADLLGQLCADVASGADPPAMAARFHHAVANMVVDVCQAVREATLIGAVGLTGGVFQNAILLRLAKKRLVEAGFEVLTHSIVPPNDGGIALGQALIARNQLQRKRDI